MRAVLFDAFGGPLRLDDVADPVVPPDGAVIEVRATGVCRSDWHGWQGHDPDIVHLPHVPGHEFAGVIREVGADVRGWHPGDRVTIPFVAGCGSCGTCVRGAPQVCPQQYQPGFSGWGSFAEAVAVRYADFNLVRLPEEMGFAEAASFGCRVGTAFRAVVQQGRVAADQWVAVHGCGGVGLAAVMFACASGARVIAVDVQQRALDAALELGAERALDGSVADDVAGEIRALTGGGVALSLDALGSRATAAQSICALRRQGRHVQVGLLAGADADAALPMGRVIAQELEVVGSHGVAAADYATLWQWWREGRIAPERLIAARIGLREVPEALAAMDRFDRWGVTVVEM